MFKFLDDPRHLKNKFVGLFLEGFYFVEIVLPNRNNILYNVIQHC